MSIQRAARGALACIAICSPSAGTSAFARDAAEAEDMAPQDNEAIIVTGSRIRLPSLSGMEPTLTIPARYLDDRGITNVADALNEISGFRRSVTPA